MSHARTLTELYWQFYRAKRPLTSNSILRPVSIVAKAVMTADPRIYVDANGLVEMVRGELYGFVDRVSKNRADGSLPRVEVDGERRIDYEAINGAIIAFSKYFVEDLFFKTLHGDVSALRGRQLNLLKNACEVIYRDLDAQYWLERNAAGEPDEESDELESADDTQSPTLFD
jgi:CRISPR-associated protein Csc3